MWFGGDRVAFHAAFEIEAQGRAQGQDDRRLQWGGVRHSHCHTSMDMPLLPGRCYPSECQKIDKIEKNRRKSRRWVVEEPGTVPVDRHLLICVHLCLPLGTTLRIVGQAPEGIATLFTSLIKVPFVLSHSGPSHVSRLCPSLNSSPHRQNSLDAFASAVGPRSFTIPIRPRLLHMHARVRRSRSACYAAVRAVPPSRLRRRWNQRAVQS